MFLNGEQVNGKKLWGLSHVQVVSVLKELPQNVVIVCARHRKPVDLSSTPSLDQESFLANSAAPLESPDRLVKAKSEQALPVVSGGGGPLNRMKSRSLEPLTGLATWSSQPEVVVLNKGDRGLGFSILDYQVSE